MAFHIKDFRASLAYSGPRPTLFRLTINGISTLAKAKYLPMQTSEEIPYFGRKIDVQLQPHNYWDVTTIGDESFTFRCECERYLASKYPFDLTVEQYTKVGEIVSTTVYPYTLLHYCGPIEMGWECNMDVEQYPLTFELGEPVA